MQALELTAQHLALALAIGFLVGIERGWKQRGEEPGARAAGLRTYALSGLLGGASGLLGLELGAFAFSSLALVFGATFLAFKLREANAVDDRSATGAIAGLVTFALGALAMVAQPSVVAGAGVAAVAVLAFKESLHSWLGRLTWEEVRSALLVLAMTLIVLPVLPDRPVDPLGLVNPHELWMLTILIAAASFLGYIAVRVFGEQRGLLIGAAAGALVSSTVVTAELARQVGSRKVKPKDAAAASSCANVAMLARVSALCAVVAPTALAQVWVPLLVAGILATLTMAVLIRMSGGQGGIGGASSLQSPLNLKAVLRFGAILSILLILVRLLTLKAGQGAVLPLAVVSGLLDVDAVVIAMGRVVGLNVTPQLAGDAILLAILADTGFKVAIAWMIGGSALGVPYGVSCVVVASAAAAARFWPI
ncbi:MAG: MgtC/SapB family protein [Caulobacterales bacterium]|jgi:uncharacterized membrane protein (DUF4010 family)